MNTTTNIVIKGLKDYSIGSKQVIKGIRKNAIEVREGVYKQEQWPSFKGLLRKGEVNTYTVKEVIKVLYRKYTKGHVNTDGSISPMLLGDEYDYSPLLY